MHVGVEEAVPDGVAQEGLDHRPAEGLRVVPGRHDGGAVVEADALDPFAGEDVAGRQLPVGLRHTEIRVALRVLGQLGHRGRFEPEVHLHHHRAGEDLHHFARAQALRFGEST